MVKGTKISGKLPLYPDITILRPGPDETRVCDYCNKVLVFACGIVKKRCFLTQYGLMCGDCCLRGIPVICGYLPGEDVSCAVWHKKGMCRPNGRRYQGKDRFRPEEAIPRVCDYCGEMLIGRDGIVREQTHLTEFNLMCRYCIGVMDVVCVYEPGEDVSKQSWYNGFHLLVPVRVQAKEEGNSNG